jgi:hypothetical protein
MGLVFGMGNLFQIMEKFFISKGRREKTGSDMVGDRDVPTILIFHLHLS